MAAIDERDVEAHLVKRVKELKGEIRKVKWIGRHAAPDRFVMLPTRQPNFWAEVKRPGYTMTATVEAQMREHDRMRAMDEIVYILDSFEAVDRALGIKR
jgi:hypothetical protein